MNTKAKMTIALILITVTVISGWLWLDTEPYSVYAPWEMNEWRVIQLRCAGPAFAFSGIVLIGAALCHWSTQHTRRETSEMMFRASLGFERHNFLVKYGIAAFEAKYGPLETYIKRRPF